jgi:signal transduction histidine kinase
MEDVYWTYSYSPVLNDQREIGGTLVICQETTGRVLSERRLDLLHVLGDRLAAERHTEASVWEVASSTIADDRSEFAFSLLYALSDDGRSVHLVRSSGSVPAGCDAATIGLAGPDDVLGLAGVLDEGGSLQVVELPAKFGTLFDERWPEPLEQAVVVPISQSAGDRHFGVVVLGLSPRLRIDESFRDFLALLTRQIATALVNSRAFEDMQAAAALKDQFLGLVSHELRTPISTVVGNAVLLSRRSDRIDAEDRAQALEDIVTEGQKLQRVIENLLQLTRLEALSPDFSRLSLKDLIGVEIDAFHRRNPTRKVSFQPDEGPFTVRGESILLAMVIENLLNNADKYSPREASIEVRLSVANNDAIEVCVRDNGIGIDESEMSDLFTPFYRTSRAKGYATGMGLGLSVCKRIVEAHGGRIWIVPRPEGGSDFCFSLPAEQ